MDFTGKAEKGSFVSNVTLESDFRVRSPALESTIKRYLKKGFSQKNLSG